MKNLFFYILYLIFYFNTNAQVGIGTTTPDDSSILDVTSTNKGFLMPRISLTSTTDTTTINGAEAESLLVYNTATVGDVTRSIDHALDKAGLSKENAPELLSDNGSCYISSELADYIQDKGMSHVRGRPNHPQTQGKIERYHRSMKNVVKLENYYYPEDLTQRLTEFVEYYNNQRYHESLDNLTPSDVYYGRGKEILNQRKLTKIKTMKKRRKNHLLQSLKL